MCLPRPRFTVRRLMVAVAIMAYLLAFAARPHPTIVIGSGLYSIIAWSDGTRTTIASRKGPAIARWRAYGPVARVDWSDGSTNWYYVGLLPWLRQTVKAL
jgi:hypothetical protein